MDFEIVIDESFIHLCSDDTLEPIENKYVLSLINDYEDGKWRYGKFHNFIWDNIAETSLSYSERESLIDQPHSKLVAAAQSLRLTDADKDDIGKGSELAEIILYGIMKHHFNALPVVPKIFYKQNSQDNAKGADSVHIVVDKDENFTIWFGEAKFFNDISNTRLGNIIISVGNSLRTDKLKRENSIITNLNDLDPLIDNKELTEEIKRCLSYKNSIDELKPKLHIPILLLHECEITKLNTSLSQQHIDEIKEYHSDRANAYYKKHIKKLSELHLYNEITFHLILFPVPLKEKIVNRFTRTVKNYKDEYEND